jgi:hypothetical protein
MLSIRHETSKLLEEKLRKTLQDIVIGIMFGSGKMPKVDKGYYTKLTTFSTAKETTR